MICKTRWIWIAALCIGVLIASAHVNAQESVYITRPKASLHKQSDKPIVRSEPLGKPTGKPISLIGSEDGAAVVTSQGERHDLRKSDVVFQNRSKASAPAAPEAPAAAEAPAAPKEPAPPAGKDEAKPATENPPKETGEQKPADGKSAEEKPAEGKSAESSPAKGEPGAKDAETPPADDKKPETPAEKAEKEQIKKDIREGLKRLDKEGGVFMRDENDQPLSREEFEKRVEAGKADGIKITDFRQDPIDLRQRGKDEPAAESETNTGASSRRDARQ
jgi:hypothetical protein